MSIPGYYTIQEAAGKTGTSEVYWRNWAGGWGQFDGRPMKGARKAGRTWLIPRRVVDQYERSVGGRPTKSQAKDAK